MASWALNSVHERCWAHDQTTCVSHKCQNSGFTQSGSSVPSGQCFEQKTKPPGNHEEDAPMQMKLTKHRKRAVLLEFPERHWEWDPECPILSLLHQVLSQKIQYSRLNVHSIQSSHSANRVRWDPDMIWQGDHWWLRCYPEFAAAVRLLVERPTILPLKP